MGFCRRCGDIVSGTRCKCGGLAVSASVNFSAATTDRDQPDHWSRTYVRSSTITPPHLRERSTTLPASTPRPFPDTPRLSRPLTTTHFPRSSIGSQVTSHIDSTLTHQPLTPVKTGSNVKDINGNSPDDILPDPNTSVLSKAYGSVLQPKESLSTFTCLVCATPFPPDATIYPDPTDPSTTTRFLCKPCFTTNGGAKGDCVACARPVLILTSEGGFIENTGRIWHKRCFRCDGCFKDVSDNPMVDLIGRPSCEDCFDTCLKRPRTESVGSRRSSLKPVDNLEKRSNLGGMKGSSREGSPALEELHQRLGIKSRESTPAVERTSAHIPALDSSPAISDLNQRLSELSTKPIKTSVSEDTHSRASDASPRGRYEKFRLPSKAPSKAASIISPSPRAENNAVEEMERRLRRQSFASSPSVRSASPTTTFSRDSISVAPSTPALTDNSDASTTFSSSSSPISSPRDHHDLFSEKTPTKPVTPNAKRASMSPSRMAMSSPSTPCSKCYKPLFRTRGGGKFVTVPEESSKGLPPRSYHVECFRCAVCDDPFEETKNGQAIFVRSSTGCCHVSCATPERIVIRPVKTKSSSVSLASSPTKQTRPPNTAPPMIGSFPRFGSGVTCPGCHISVSPMERGVVPGPQGSRWHASCLVCGGKGRQSGPRRDLTTPGCGKRLDSAAKTDGEGGVWCRECLLLVDSPCRQDSINAIEPSFTGGTAFGRFPAAGIRRNEGITPQLTGTTTIARQFTGMGALTSQLTGGGLNPTRQLPKDLTRSPSPTKNFMMNNTGEGRRVPFPRPKSVGGVRGKSMDEGRGMFLVRQLTGGGGGGEMGL